MNKLYKTTVIIFLILGLIGIAYLLFDNRAEIVESFTVGGEADEPRDVYGIQTGTTTTATSNASDPGYPTGAPNSDFSNAAKGADNGYSTTSKPVILNGTTDTALFTFRALTATPNGSFYYEIYGSNDTYCTTTATSTTDSDYNTSGTIPLVSDINWYNIGSDGSLVSGSIVNPNSIAVATSTSRLLTNLNWKCLKVDLRGASTTVGVQLREKTNN